MPLFCSPKQIGRRSAIFSKKIGSNLQVAEKLLTVEFKNPWNLLAEFNSDPTYHPRASARKTVRIKLAEREGFEPSIPFWSMHAFQACAFSHSAISPPNLKFDQPRRPAQPFLTLESGSGPFCR